jgi:hypothetical protein
MRNINRRFALSSSFELLSEFKETILDLIFDSRIQLLLSAYEFWLSVLLLSWHRGRGKL